MIGTTDYLAGMSFAQKQFNFTNSTNIITNTSSSTPPSSMINLNAQYLKQYYSFSSYVLNFGVKFNLPSKAKQ